MTSDEIRSFLDRFVHAWERQDVAALSACYADDCEVVSPIFGTMKGRAQVEKSYTDLFKAFANPTVRMEDTIVCNSELARAVIVWTVQSTHAGEVFGMPATGRRIERTMAYLFTLRDGLIIRERRVYDFTSMLMQLGVLKARPA
ncbi:MAG: ester cyclase [Acidobacteria bacterium]|nr:ester cyclase [Acidobacteriota bacterium]